MKEPAASFVLNVTDIQTIVNAKLLAYTSVLVDEYTAAVAITLWDKLCTDKTQLHDTMSGHTCYLKRFMKSAFLLQTVSRPSGRS